MATNIAGLKISANHWSDGKLLMDLQYTGDFFKGDYQEAGGVFLAAAAIFDTANGKWDMLEYPEAHADPITIGFKKRYIELFHGDLYLSTGGRLQRYDFKTSQWTSLEVPGLNNSQLFAINGHFYAANAENILEITDYGKGSRILASTRRRPAVAVLDSLDNLGSSPLSAGANPLPPQLFSGPDHSLCARVGNKIFTWDGNDWHEPFILNITEAPEIFGDAVIFRSVPQFDPADLWIWKKDRSVPELCLHEKAKPHPGIIITFPKPENQTIHPLWKSPDGDYLASAGATYFKSNLYFFVDHCVVTNVSNHWTVTERDGYHAKLVCLGRDLPEPIVVPLRFDLQRGQPPLKSLGEKMEQIPWETGASWMHFAGDTLYMGQPDTPGIWAIPVSEIESAVSAQKQLLLAKRAQAIATTEKRHKDLLEKYDGNHNGIIDPDEREAALDDPAFIETELDVIDANHNGRLDAEELVWFDANRNKILEPREQTGIDIAQHLLAAKLLKQFDANGDGFLDRSEFDNLRPSGPEAGTPFIHNIPFPDENHDGQVDLGEVESFLKQQTHWGLRLRGGPTAALFNQSRGDTNQPFDPRQLFKTEVELYWQNPGGITHGPPFNRRTPPGWIGGTNSMPNNKTP